VGLDAFERLDSISMPGGKINRFSCAWTKFLSVTYTTVHRKVFRHATLNQIVSIKYFDFPSRNCAGVIGAKSLPYGRGSEKRVTSLLSGLA
jgi:hypothetical protein